MYHTETECKRTQNARVNFILFLMLLTYENLSTEVQYIAALLTTSNSQKLCHAQKKHLASYSAFLFAFEIK